MLNAIRRFIADLARDDDLAAADRDDAVELAVTALLCHLIAVDGAVTDDERAALTDLLASRFGIDHVAAEGLAKRGEIADAEAIDLYSFTSLLKERLDAERREGVVEMMWRLVYADGTVHEFEDNVVWRVAELLAVPTQTRVRLKQSVRDDAG